MTYRDGKPGARMIGRSRELRGLSTDAERLLWRLLRGSQLGAKFRRQHELGPYILDFYCVEGGLAVEVDGSQHAEPIALKRDEARERFLQSRGLRVLRFSDRQVLLELPGVLEAIGQMLEKPSP